MTTENAKRRARAHPSINRRFERLPDTNLRLHRQSNEAGLFQALVEEVGTLLGARRVLLVMQVPQVPQAGPAAQQVVGARLPKGEQAGALLQAVAPWLLEAHDTRASRLRHGPEGADAMHQRSCLVAPLLAPQGLLGCVYADVEGPQGRFEDADRSLLAMLASQAATALTHLRSDAALRHEAEQRTADANAAQAAQQATAQVLQLIGRSVADTGPVFDKILEGCERLFTMAGLELLNESQHDDWEAPPNRGETRAQAIDRWLAAHHRGEPYVILDDELSGTGLSRSVHEKRGRLVLCKEAVGLHRGHLALIRAALTKAP